MINLMPPEAKTNILYARRSLHLLHWTIGSLMVIVAMAATVILGGIYIDNAKNHLNQSIAGTKDTITTQKLDAVKTQAENLSSGVKIVVQTLSKEVLFSKLIKQLGGLMPTGATLTSLQLSNKINGGLDLTANAADATSATQVQVNLQDAKNGLFDKVDTVSVTCSDPNTVNSAGEPTRYPCQIVIRALFKKDAAVTFLANPPAKATGTTP